MFKDSDLSREHVGMKDCFFMAEVADFLRQKMTVSLEPPDFSVTFVLAFCVLISRHMRKSGSFAGKELLNDQ